MYLIDLVLDFVEIWICCNARWTCNVCGQFKNTVHDIRRKCRSGIVTEAETNLWFRVYVLEHCVWKTPARKHFQCNLRFVIYVIINHLFYSCECTYMNRVLLSIYLKQRQCNGFSIFSKVCIFLLCFHLLKLISVLRIIDFRSSLISLYISVVIIL